MPKERALPHNSPLPVIDAYPAIVKQGKQVRFSRARVVFNPETQTVRVWGVRARGVELLAEYQVESGQALSTANWFMVVEGAGPDGTNKPWMVYKAGRGCGSCGGAKELQIMDPWREVNAQESEEIEDPSQYDQYTNVDPA